MRDAASDLSRLPPGELKRLAREHVDGLFAELSGAWGYARRRYAPTQVARKHPVATAAAAAIVGLLVGRALRHMAAERAAPEPARRGLKGTALGLAGAAVRLLPRLLRGAWTRHRKAKE